MKRVSKHLLAVAMLLFLGATVCSANLISYSTWPARRDKMMVMDEDGGNPVELLVMSKGSFPTGGSISPAGLEETWIVFNDLENIYKIRPDGSDQTLVLCAPGTNHPFGLGDPIWSPDGSEILVTPYDEFHPSAFLALVPANHTAGDTCSSEWTPIYEFSSPWGLDAEPAWNHDGSRMAFTEWNVETEVSYLVVIERQPSGPWQPIDSIPVPVNNDFDPRDLSWRPQAESGLLIFRVRDPYSVWLGSIDLATGVWDYVLDGGSRIEMTLGSTPRWSSNGEEILFTDPEGDLVIWNYLNGARRTVGSGTWADWQRDAVAGVCGDDDCAGSETQCNCALDCGTAPITESSCTDSVDNDCFGDVDCDDPDCFDDSFCADPYCGDTFCDLNEDQCSCSVDCGTPPGSEAGLCSDDFDNDCDALTDCEDSDCASDSACSSTCLPKDIPCDTGAECCSGLCHPKKLVCK